MTTTPLARSIRLTRRVTDIQVSGTLAVLNKTSELIAQGHDIVDFGPGEPDFPTPHSVSEAGKAAIDRGFTKYTNALGIKSLRDAIANRYNRRYGTSIRPENVIAGNGGKQEL
ncbi:MAG TPA: aminotransferase class I/II-fold pyridoxal phosphate-dependent enzyme, partial [Thermoanaerobaculia bacterium]